MIVSKLTCHSALNHGSWSLVFKAAMCSQTLRRTSATDAGAVADVLRSVCEHIAALNTKDQDPWLRAEWQVSFETIMRAAVVTLASMGQPKARAAGAH